MSKARVIAGDSRKVLKKFEDNTFNCCITSPPYYGLRDYGHEDQMGAEQTPEQYVTALVDLFREVRRVLREDGSLWLNLGDSYYNYRPGKGQRQSKQSLASQKFSEVEVCHKRGRKLEGLKEKDLIGIPWRVAFALQADGWYLRQDIIWAKPNPMPESVKDRCTRAHEYIFLLTKNKKYYFDSKAICEPATTTDKNTRDRDNTKLNNVAGRKRMGGLTHNQYTTRNKRSVWAVGSKAFKGAHSAVYPPKLIEPCILAGCPEGGLILDPFGGSGTTGVVARQHGRNAVLVEINEDYAEMARGRIATST